ncbi:exported hypothetical protein [Syntrophobacter sp. SbD1]|nr:exported hypothetical protein [Syntrophobacter sp. SbD1]
MNKTMKKALAGLAFGLACAVCGTAALAQTTTALLKTPYMIYPVLTSTPGATTSMEVLWQDSGVPTTPDTLSWGTDSTYTTFIQNVQVAQYGTANQCMYTITGLTANTTYYYQVVDSTGFANKGSFITAPDASATSVRFLAQGDSRSCPIQLDALMYAMTQFYSQPGNSDYQRLSIANGDWVSSDAESNWTPQWFSNTNMPDVRAYTANVPINGIRGNHDTSGSYPWGTATYFPKYFPFPYQNTTTITGSGSSRAANATTFNPATVQAWSGLYWSFDYGPAHIICLDEYANMASGSPQYTWLVNDLQNTTKQWKILLYHEASYSAGADGDNGNVLAIEPLITQYNVNVVYSGHSHNYARCGAYNAAQANGDNIALNVPHITSGGGGAPIYQVDQSNTGSWPHVITAWPSLEFMTFDIEGNNLTMTAYQVNGLGNYSNYSLSELQTTPPNQLPPYANLSITPIETVVLHNYANVTSQVTATVGNFGYNHQTKMYNGTVKLTNNGPALTGNVHVVTSGILNLPGIGTADNEYDPQADEETSGDLPTNGGVAVTTPVAQNPGTGKNSPAGSGELTNLTLVNQTGSNNGEPMIQASSTGLGAGQSVTVELQFSNPTNGPIHFTPMILNGN